MSNPFKFYRLKSAPTTSISESVTVTLKSSEAPEAELAKWQEVLNILGKQKEVSPQEALAKEVVRKRIKELKGRVF